MEKSKEDLDTKLIYSPQLPENSEDKDSRWEKLFPISFALFTLYSTFNFFEYQEVKDHMLYNPGHSEVQVADHSRLKYQNRVREIYSEKNLSNNCKTGEFIYQVTTLGRAIAIMTK